MKESIKHQPRYRHHRERNCYILAILLLSTNYTHYEKMRRRERYWRSPMFWTRQLGRISFRKDLLTSLCSQLPSCPDCSRSQTLITTFWFIEHPTGSIRAIVANRTSRWHISLHQIPLHFTCSITSVASVAWISILNCLELSEASHLFE